MLKFIHRITANLRLFWMLYGNYKWQIACLVILGFSGGLLEGFGIGTLIPIFSFFIKGDAGSDVGAVALVVQKTFSFVQLPFTLPVMLTALPVIFIFRAAVLSAFHYIRVRILANYEYNMKSGFFRNTLNMRWRHLLNQKIGHLENMLTVDVDYGVKMFEYFGGAILNFTNLIVYVVIALSISATVTFATLLLGLAVLLIFKPFIFRTRHYAKGQAVLNRDIAHLVNEHIMGLKTIKAMNIAEAVAKVADAFFAKMKELRVKRIMVKNLTTVSIEPITVTYVAAIFYLSYIKPDFNFASSLVIIYLIQRIFVYIDKAQISLHNINEALPFLHNILDAEREMSDNRELAGGGGEFSFNKELILKNINFSYNGGEPVLRGVNLRVQKGEMVGIIGPSGSGKTTIVDLLLRLFEPQSGDMLLDGLAVAGISVASWRNNIGYVSQDLFLKNDTIRNNIKFYSDEITDGDMEQAAKMANIYDFVGSLPQGFETVIGERGIMLSGGERQRIVLARILARKPKLLILDEATSALDNESEMQVKKAIDQLKGGVTIVVIAHRLSTIMDADRLYAIEGGRIVEEGTPEKLLQDSSSYFHKMANL